MNTRTFGLVLFLGLAPTLPVASDTPQGTWKQIDDDEGVKVWKLEIPGRDMPGFKGEALIPASAARITEELNHVEWHTQWMHNCIDAGLIKKIDDDHTIIYNRTDTPWPVWDRDVILETQTQRSVGGKEIVVTFKNTDPKLRPLPSRVIRMPRLVGSYKMVEREPGKTVVTYTVEVDPGGSLPGWLAERVAKDMPYQTLSRLRKRLAKKA